MRSPLPAHFPVVSLPAYMEPRYVEPRHEELLAKLLRRLAERQLRVTLRRVGRDRAAENYSPVPVDRLVLEYDLVLIDDDSVQPGAELLLGPGASADTGCRPAVHRFHCRDIADIDDCITDIHAWLVKCCERTPLWGCVLIGGESSRMGFPKHLLINDQGLSWLEHIVDVVGPYVDRCVLAGAGTIPAPLGHLLRVDDLPGVAGPLGGIGGAMEAIPFVSWLLIACDMPDISGACLSWLLGHRRPGTVAIIPCNPQTEKREPLLAWYDFRCVCLVRDLIADGERRITGLCARERVRQPSIPEILRGCWRNINRPEDR